MSNIAEIKEPHLLTSLEKILELIQKEFQENHFELQTFTDIPSLRYCAVKYFNNKNYKSQQKLRHLGKIMQFVTISPYF